MRKYWPEILTFGLIAYVLVTCLAPDFTWINTDSDGVHYWFSAANLLPAHKTSAPLFLLLEKAFLFIPYGSEFWRMALLSAIATITGSVFVYLIIRHHTNNRGASLLGALVYGGSALVISQSTIVETYALNTCLLLIGYWFILKKHFRLACAVFGASLTVHFISGIGIIVFLIFYKELRNWRNFLFAAPFALLFLYMPLTNREPFMWWPDPQTTNYLEALGKNILAFIQDNFDTGSMLVGGIAIWDLPKRLIDTSLIYLVSLGLMIVPVFLYAWDRRKTWYKSPFIWIFILYSFLFIGNLAPQTYVYLIPAIAFSAIMGCIWLKEHLTNKYWKTYALISIVGVSGMIGFNFAYFDIGNTLDPNLQARRYYDVELAKVPEGSILLCQWGWDWAACYPYMQENNKSFVPVCIGTLPSPIYQADLKRQNVNYWQPPEVKYSYADEIAESIIDLNDNVYMTVPMGEDYGCEIIKADKTHLIVTNTVNDIKVNYQFSNPYEFITGAIEVREWQNISYTNYSLGFFVMIGGIGGGVTYLVNILVNKPEVIRRKIKSLIRRPKDGIFRPSQEK